uniref:Uncharacterized protein n=1 Tax=Branchiostoma floridae TaxID=7739 RepID=C3Y2D4_BRAFL|eukprot:XP_002610014.1 hypothetical protein BRAFLDRAFT_131119 [Branchiostoma floridae]
MSISAGIVIFEGKFLPEVVRNGRKYVPVDSVVDVLFPRVPSHVDPFDIFRELGGHTGVQQHIASWPETRVLQNIQGISHGKPREGTFPLVLLDDLKLCYPELCRICKRYGSKVDKAREEDGRQTMQAEDRDGYRNRDSKETRTKQKTDLLTTNNHSGRGEASPSTNPLKASRIASLEQKVKSVERRCKTDVKKVDAVVDTPHEQSNGFKNRGESSRNKSHLNPSSLKNNACYTDYKGWVVIDQVTAESECSSVLTLESGKTKNDRHCHPADTNPVSNNACSHEEPQKGHIRDLTDQQEESPEEFTSQHTSPRLHCPPTGVAPCSVGMHKSPLCTTPTTCGGPQEHEESSDPAVEVCPVSPHASQNPDASVGETGSSCQNSAVKNRSVQGETPNIRADDRYLLEKISPDPKGNISVTKVEESQGSTTYDLHDRGNQITNSSATMASSMQSPRRELDLPHQHTKADKKDTSSSTNSSTVSESDIPPATGIQRDRNLWSSLEMLDLFAGNIEDVGGSARPAGKGCTIDENIAVHNNGVTPPDLSPPRSRVEISRSSEMASAHCLHKDLSRASDLKVPEKDNVSMETTAGRRDVRGTTSSTTASVEVTGNAEKTGLDAVTSHRPASRLGGKDTAIATETPYNQLKQVRIEPTDCKGSTDDTEEESIGLVMECVPEPTFTKASLANHCADDDQLAALAGQLIHAFSTTGFVYLWHHGIPPAQYLVTGILGVVSSHRHTKCTVVGFLVMSCVCLLMVLSGIASASAAISTEPWNTFPGPIGCWYDWDTERNVCKHLNVQQEQVGMLSWQVLNPHRGWSCSRRVKLQVQVRPPAPLLYTALANKVNVICSLVFH